YSKTLDLLLKYNLISMDKRGINIVIEINPEGIIELLMNILSQEGFKPKILNPPSIFGIDERLITFELDKLGQKIIFPIFIKSPTENMIKNLKAKWLYGISFPLFSIVKESDFRKLNSFGDFPHLTVSELISSIFEGRFTETLSSKLSEISKKYSEERIKDSRKIISEMEEIISNKQSKKKFREFETNIYYLQRYLFTGTQKIGGGYLPDGIRLPEREKVVKNSLNSGVAIWDAKIWFSDFNIDEEKEKIARYILASLKNEEIYEKGDLSYDFIIGHLECGDKTLKKIFNESKKIALKKANRYKDISKVSIKKIKLIYFDFEAIKSIIEWINSKDSVKLNEARFYQYLNEFVVSKDIIKKQETEEFLEDVNKRMKNNEKEIDLKKFREIGKKIKIEFDNN
ncbi:MAG: hypothetical protein KJ646_01100, partial [Nanoarchaeota archaeon]|nr:hypothetical protein [Nanoarchaeota archaeon]